MSQAQGGGIGESVVQASVSQTSVSVTSISKTQNSAFLFLFFGGGDDGQSGDEADLELGVSWGRVMDTGYLLRISWLFFG